MLAAFSMVMERDEIRTAAQLHLPVLVTAGSYEQREMCARVIHASWDRGRGPFVTFSAERRGADTDDRLGREFERARGGTLFIADVAALSMRVQQQLFSLLDESAPAAAPLPGRVDHSVRIVAGASRHLDAERASGTFHESLFYRLNVLHFDLLAAAAAC